MKKRSLFTAMILICYSSLTTAAAVLDLKDGTYLAKEYGGQGRYALIDHSHGRIEGGDIAIASCTNGFVVSKLPPKFKKIKKILKPTDYVLTKCSEES